MYCFGNETHRENRYRCIGKDEGECNGTALERVCGFVKAVIVCSCGCTKHVLGYFLLTGIHKSLSLTSASYLAKLLQDDRSFEEVALGETEGHEKKVITLTQNLIPHDKNFETLSPLKANMTKARKLLNLELCNET